MQTLFVVSHTHWDREWYEPFQVFRLKLVKCIDKLLDLFATDPDYKYFLLDGQTIVLEDYLEVRPDREPTLRDLISSGRLNVGPWYVLPDEFLVSGEAIIRNLLRGTRIANRFGGTMRIGYIPDPFGHISQMPQILRGFSFSASVFRRGLADEPTELWWQAPDGTRILACYLRDSYDNAAWLARDSAGFIAGIKQLRDSLAPHAVTKNILLMNGTDHMEPWQDLPALLRTARDQITDAQLIHASLPMYVEQVESEIARNQTELQVAHGELRNPKRHHLLPGVASMRMWIKQRNARAQVLLEKWAEPFAAIEVGRSAWKLKVGESPSNSIIDAERLTSNIQRPIPNVQLIALAWKYLLQNHPHDSICGCSVDETHADMVPRFNWVEQIANSIIDESLATIAAQIDTQTLADAIPLIVFNPVAGLRTDLVTSSIETNWGHFVLLDDAKNEIPYRIQAQNMIEFVARDIPGHGYRTFQVARRQTTTPSSVLRPSSLIIENEYFRIEPNRDDGTLTITDKSTGAVYHGGNHFVEGGDRGDLYNYCPPENDLLIAQPSTPPQIEIERNSVRQSLHIMLNYRLPAHLSNDRASRAQEFIEENIETVVSIYPAVRRIDFQTSIDNRARDHRLRVEFPSPIVAAYASADQAFDVVQRSLDLPSDTDDWIEQPRPEAPMQSFVSISDGKIGLTLAMRGLPEYEARRDQNGTTLALTLLRCVGWLSRDDLATRKGHAGPAMQTPGAQEIGRHVFEYAIIPHAGDWHNAFSAAHEFTAPMRGVSTDTHSGTLPLTASFVQISPSTFVITAIKLPEEGTGLIVRGYNIGDTLIDARIVVWRKFARATRVNLNEEEIAPIELQDGYQAHLQVRPKEIVTLKFVE